MEEIKVSEMLQAESINKDDSVMIIQSGVNKKASGSIQTATGTSLSLTSVADTCEVKSNSVNLFDKDNTISGALLTDGTVGSSSVTRISNYIPVKANTTYVFSYDYTTLANSNPRAYCFYNVSQTYISGAEYNPTTKLLTLTPTQNGYVRISYDINIVEAQCEEGSTATSYNPYNTKVGIAVKELQLEDGSLLAADGTPFYMPDRRRTVNFIEIDATKQHIINTGSYQLSVLQYKADGTYLGSSQGWQNSPYTLTPNAQTGKIKIIIPNSNAKTYDLSIDDIRPQVLTLKPGEEDVAFTYDTETIVESNGSVTITYNTQSRLLNNDDVLDIVEPVKEYADEKIEKATTYSTDEVAVGKWIDGKPIYRKVISFASSNNMNLTKAHNLTNADKLWLNGNASFIFGGSVTESLPVNYYNNANDFCRTWLNARNIRVVSPSSFGTDRTFYVVIEYTKTTD